MKNVQVLAVLLLLSGASQLFAAEHPAAKWHTRAIEFLRNRDCSPVNDNTYEKCKNLSLYEKAFLPKDPKTLQDVEELQEKKALKEYAIAVNCQVSDFNPNYSDALMREVFLTENTIFLEEAIKIASSDSKLTPDKKSTIVSTLKNFRESLDKACNDQELSKIFKDADDYLTKTDRELFDRVVYS